MSATILFNIAKNCVIAAGVNIIDSNGHEVASYERTKGRDIANPIKIGNNVWISANAIILKGTIIGDNCVVGAGSVVKGKFPIIPSSKEIPLHLRKLYF